MAENCICAFLYCYHHQMMHCCQVIDIFVSWHLVALLNGYVHIIPRWMEALVVYHSTFISIRTLTILSCMSTVSVVTRHPLLHASNIVLMIFAIGWQQIVCRWILLRLSCSGLAPNTTFRCWIAMLRSCISAQILWLPAITYGCSESLFRPTCVSRSMCLKTCSASFHWLHQLRRVRKSLDDGSAATFVHAFVTSRVDYCNALYAGAPKTVTDKLQRVLNAAARVASGTRKFDHGLTTLLHDEVHWLDVPEIVTYKLGVMMYRCLHGLAPRYLADHLTSASDVVARLRLRSANRHQLIVPRCRLSTYGRRAFSIYYYCRSDGLEFIAGQTERSNVRFWQF